LSGDLAVLLQGFFTDKLIHQRQASAHTISAYRDAFRLLLAYLSEQTAHTPAQLSLTDLPAETIGAFLQYLETTRGNTASTRNARLAAIHSFFAYAALRAPEHAALIQPVLAIPAKRFDRAILAYLDAPEIEALLGAPNTSTWIGRRDHALLLLASHTGLRVSELTGLNIADLQTGPGPHVRCHGKGRKDRITPLTTPCAATMRTWITERGGHLDDVLFPSRRGTRLSRDAVERLVTKYAAVAEKACPTMQDKHVTPHTLRHSTAMALLHAGVDITVIALWLGHESTETTQIYLHADMSIKERALARTTPPGSTPGRYQAPDTLLAFLDNL
jgi:integrase/recombinase XerD